MGWKEAATLILVRPFLKGLAKRPLPNVGNNASANMQRFQQDHDYEVYTGVRTAKSNFFAGTLVFPGGAVEKTDFDASEWKDLLNERNHVPSPCSSVPLPMYGRQGLPSCSMLDPRVALRLCAIRELAEETGLIVGSKSTLPILDASRSCPFATSLAKRSLLPGVNMLYDWRCWLTPKSLEPGNKKAYRYDTAFYLAFIDDEASQINSMQKGSFEELLKCQWATVPELLSQFLCRKLTLPPPQLTELTTLLRYPKYADLKRFVTQEMIYNKLDRWAPVMARFAGKPLPAVAILPGDSCYPGKDAAVEMGWLDIEDTLEESCRKSKQLNRVQFVTDKSKPNLKFFCNLTTPFPTGQLPALSKLLDI